jgi:hypothetical protein
MRSHDRKPRETTSTRGAAAEQSIARSLVSHLARRATRSKLKPPLLAAAALLSALGCRPAQQPPETAAKADAAQLDAAVPSASPDGSSGASPLSASYRLAGRDVALRGGTNDEPAAPGSAARNSTTVWGAPTTADLDGDGDSDAVLILVNDPGGSGTFFYVAAAEKAADVYRGSEARLLGDRIEPQNVTFAAGVVTVDYAERRADEPASASPSVGASRRFSYVDHELRELPSDAAITTSR